MPNGDLKRFNIWHLLVTALITGLLTFATFGISTYGKVSLNRNDIEHLETQNAAISARLIRIEDKLDRILEGGK